MCVCVCVCVCVFAHTRALRPVPEVWECKSLAASLLLFPNGICTSGPCLTLDMKLLPTQQLNNRDSTCIVNNVENIYI